MYPEGYGRAIYRDGTCYLGMWKAGEYHGYGYKFDIAGKIKQEGEWTQGICRQVKIKYVFEIENKEIPGVFPCKVCEDYIETAEALRRIQFP